MKIGIAADHGGVVLKAALRTRMASRGVAFVDFGCNDTTSVDYPDYAAAVAVAMERGDIDQGILICTSGIGMSMSANRFPHVRAALCTTPRMAEMARDHNDANVLVLGASITAESEGVAILDAWLTGTFSKGERHQRRIAKLSSNAAASMDLAALREGDADIYASVVKEAERQHLTLNLIASENGVSRAVRQAQGCVMTNKYAEGYPGKRWYSGCDFVDQAESLAINRAKALFGADHANVQPHCGSSANMAVYFSMLEPGDTILAMSLADGGHLTHGSPVNFSGKLFNVVSYGVSRETERLDFDVLASLAKAHQPKLIVAGASAYSRTLEFDRFRDVADSVGARLM
ncbi:MAG TPA: ribose 5-phosphate isomerase B, partial [Verrucomicrobia bacterium]|nr:ribose 5-phosphate isomerase B [Verrucomicrobiota bacterium]